jgi:heat-inducible transcriptional repressor
MKMFQDLTDRESIVLQLVIHNYILSATPVGSRVLARRHAEIGLSPATIRNTMADLEEKGLLTHPHTSAGRVPTDLGYRLYVDDLMEFKEISRREKETIIKEIESIPGKDIKQILAVTAKTLGKISSLLGVIISPRFSEGILERIDLIRVAEGKLLVIITIQSGLVKTIMLELETVLKDSEVTKAARYLNSRLVGLSFHTIRSTIENRLRPLSGEEAKIIRFFIDDTDRFFQMDDPSESFMEGTMNVLSQPEFSTADRMRSIIEFVENKDVVIHLIEKRKEQEGISITIGEENPDRIAKTLSVVTSDYRVGTVQGTMGVIGPTRMDYSKLISLVDYTAQVVTKYLTS